MNDLFKLFPPLPSLYRRPMQERLDEIRSSVDRVREKAKTNAEEHKALAARLKSRFDRRRHRDSST